MAGTFPSRGVWRRPNLRPDAAVLLGLAEVHGADLELTDAGREFVTADIDASKLLFGKLAAERAADQGDRQGAERDQ
jgi:C-terminal AAA-associated domain